MPPLPPGRAATGAARVLTRWYVVAALAWFGRYLTLGTVPWLRDPLWLGWFDQSRYLRSAVAFAHGDLHPAAHWYPLLYPLLATPFGLLLPGDPFFLFDLLLYLLTCLAFLRVTQMTGLPARAAVACFLLTTIAQTGLASAWVHPWTSTLSAALTWWLILLIYRSAAPRHAAAALPFAIGALAGAIPLVRPVDALASATALLIAIGLRWRARAPLWPWLGTLAAGAAGVVLPYSALYLAIYGWAPTPYTLAAAKTGFVLTDLGWKAYTLLNRAEPWYPGARSVLQVLPWAAAGAAGLAARAIARPAERLPILLFAALAMPGTVLMLAYADLQPPGLWEFSNIHYFKWLMPMLGLGVIRFVQALRDPGARRTACAAAGSLAVVLGFRIEPVAAGEAVPARMLVYRGRPGRDWAEAYFASVVIRDGRGTMATVNDFHQVPGPDGEREIAVRRLFDREPRRFDPGDDRSTEGKLPVRRYGEAVSWFGIPLD